jgi:hypothetical protein
MFEDVYLGHRMQPLLLGVQHGQPGGLLDKSCMQGFAERIAHTVTDECMIIIEGPTSRHVWRRGMFRYRWMRMCARAELGKFKASPALVWSDHRQELSLLIKTIRSYGIISELIGRSTIECPLWKNRAELISHYVSGQVLVSYNDPLSINELAAITDAKRLSAKFDDDIIALADQNRTRGRTYIVVGYLHAISLHRFTGWPIDVLFDHDPMLELRGCALMTLAARDNPNGGHAA